jgi:hypothetical protein
MLWVACLRGNRQMSASKVRGVDFGDCGLARTSDRQPQRVFPGWADLWITAPKVSSLTNAEEYLRQR